MANHKSAKKRTRQTIKRTAINKARKATLRTESKKVDTAISSGDKKAAVEALKKADKVIQKTARKGTMHKNTAARRQSRLAKKVNKVGK
jgi:small subunit ribosomal protein S20